MSNNFDDLEEYSYSISLLGAIRDLIAGYAQSVGSFHNGVSIAREFIQNADDAHADWIEFYFTPQKLVIRNNSVFDNKNFKAILEVASASKREEQNAIGTWGTGFVTSFLVADLPEIHSAGRCFIVDPNGHKRKPLPTTVINASEFRLTWRRPEHNQEVAYALQVKSWDDNNIAAFRAQLGTQIESMLLFLRQVRRISIFEGLDEPVLLYQVERKLEKTWGNASNHKRIELITAFDSLRTPQMSSQEWIYYYRRFSDVGYRDTNGKEIKSPGIELAYLRQAGPVNGRIYNYLPTNVLTGFAFHLNGDFFPNPDRDKIRCDKNSDEAVWNEKVVGELASLYADNLEDIRDEELLSIENFYRLLPVLPLSEPPFLNKFPKKLEYQLTKTENPTPVIFTTDNKWTLASKTFWTTDNALRNLTESYLPSIAPAGLLIRVLDFIKNLHAQELKLKDLFGFIREKIPPATPLAEAHPVANNYEKLCAIFDYLNAQFYPSSGPLVTPLSYQAGQAEWPF